jgi:bacterioferritin-associated ferredoxin
MIVCLCANISDKIIKHHIINNGATFEDLQIDLGVCIQCGCCKPMLDDMFEELKTE